METMHLLGILNNNSEHLEFNNFDTRSKPVTVEQYLLNNPDLSSDRFKNLLLIQLSQKVFSSPLYGDTKKPVFTPEYTDSEREDAHYMELAQDEYLEHHAELEEYIFNAALFLKNHLRYTKIPNELLIVDLFDKDNNKSRTPDFFYFHKNKPLFLE
jgi:hypothetical protein